MQHPLARGTDVALLESGTQGMDLVREDRHETLGERGVTAKRGEELAFGIGAHARSRRSDGVAPIG